MPDTDIGVCIYCNRTLSLKGSHYRLHRITPDSPEKCPMSYQRLPVNGLSEDDFEVRARLVADLAWQVQDSDPSRVFAYLTALSAREIQMLLMVALAGIPVEQTVEQMFSWVSDLPAAKLVPA